MTIQATGRAALAIILLALCALLATGCGPMGDLQVINALGMGDEAPIIRELYVVPAGSNNRRHNLVEDSPLTGGDGVVLLDVAARLYDIHAVDASGGPYTMANIEVFEAMLTEAYITPDFAN